MFAILLELLGFCLGAPVGHYLASRGVTAETALKGRALPAVIVVVVAAATAAVFYFRQRFLWIPPMPLLYAEAWLTPGLQILAGFALGLVVFLEWPGRHDRKRRQSLVLASIAFLACLGYLVWQAVPLTNRLGAPSLRDGVVMQTTSYTCAPSSIATLARHVLGDTTATERSVTALSGTTRGGTNTLAAGSSFTADTVQLTGGVPVQRHTVVAGLLLAVEVAGQQPLGIAQLQAHATSSMQARIFSRLFIKTLLMYCLLTPRAWPMASWVSSLK